jgi:hypothetical protein
MVHTFEIRGGGKAKQRLRRSRQIKTAWMQF